MAIFKRLRYALGSFMGKTDEEIEHGEEEAQIRRRKRRQQLEQQQQEQQLQQQQEQQLQQEALHREAEQAPSQQLSGQSYILGEQIVKGTATALEAGSQMGGISAEQWAKQIQRAKEAAPQSQPQQESAADQFKKMFADTPAKEPQSAKPGSYEELLEQQRARLRDQEKQKGLDRGYGMER